MRKNTANVTGARNHAEMAVARQSKGQKTNAQIRSYQNWIMSRPAEYWDETLEKRAANALRFSAECRRNSALIIAAVQRPAMDTMFENMVFTLIDMQCDLDGLNHKWEFPVVVDATAALLAQLKRLGGQKAAWAHKQNPASIARKWYDPDTNEETRNRHLFFLIDKDLDQELFYKKKAQFADPEMYDKWYKHEFYIDGEDASEFINRVPRTRHARSLNDFQASIAVTEGWKHYKELRSADFNVSIAANLAYWRGYITGMEWAYRGDGREALSLMGLKSTDKFF